MNNEACKLFESANLFDVEEGCTLMKELVIPSLPSISETEYEADILVAESLRGRWCTYVGLPDIEGIHFVSLNVECAEAKCDDCIVKVMIDNVLKKMTNKRKSE